MARENWVYLNMDKPLIQKVDKLRSQIFQDGVLKYPDRRSFVTVAITQLIAKEEKKLVTAEAVVN